MQGKQPIYTIERYVAIGEDKVLFNDGSHIIYVNGKYRGDDDIGKLMHDFSCTDPDKMHFEALAKRARYFKQNEKGVAVMGRFREEIMMEAALDTSRETAERLINMGKLSLEEIAECLPLISLEELKEIEAKTMQTT